MLNRNLSVRGRRDCHVPSYRSSAGLVANVPEGREHLDPGRPHQIGQGSRLQISARALTAGAVVERANLPFVGEVQAQLLQAATRRSRSPVRT